MPRPFPDGFTWGTATAAHQIEGGNWNNDWWEWEHTPGSGCKESSGDGCDSWNRWADDVAVIAELGFDNYRFSIEWSRIEPEEGEWSHAAIQHYLVQCGALLAAGIDPVVTFHHFTTPRWVAAKGGWADPATADRFAAFCERAAGELGPLIRKACTINEPNVVSTLGYLAGMFPPGVADVQERRKVNGVLCDAHRKAVDAIRRATDSRIPVGVTVSMSDYQAVDGGESKRDQIRRRMEDEFLEATEGDDFVGVQTYTRTVVGPEGAREPAEDERLIMGYELWPDALAATIRRAWEVTKGEVPIVVTENGIGTDDDDQRVAYVQRALAGVLDCLDEGIDVRGYTYWSLLDNFEWAYGYGPRFGLVDVDRTTFARTPKASARWLASIAKANAI